MDKSEGTLSLYSSLQLTEQMQGLDAESKLISGTGSDPKELHTGVCGFHRKRNRGVQFRIWATNILKKYMKKGFAMDDDRLKKMGGGFE